MNYLEQLEQYNHNLVMENKRLAREYKSIVSEAAGVPLDRKSDEYQGVSKIGNKAENSDDLTPDDNLKIRECGPECAEKKKPTVRNPREEDEVLEEQKDDDAVEVTDDADNEELVDVSKDNETDVSKDNETDVSEPTADSDEADTSDDVDVTVVDDDVPADEDGEDDEVTPIDDETKQKIIDLGVDTKESDCRFSIHFEDETDENFQAVLEILATAGVTGAVAITDFGTYIAVAKECDGETPPPDGTDDDDSDLVDVTDDDDTVEIDDNEDEAALEVVDEGLNTRGVVTGLGAIAGGALGAAGGAYLDTRKINKDIDKVYGTVDNDARELFMQHPELIGTKEGEAVVRGAAKDIRSAVVNVARNLSPELRARRRKYMAVGAAAGAGIGAAAGYGIEKLRDRKSANKNNSIEVVDDEEDDTVDVTESNLANAGIGSAVGALGGAAIGALSTKDPEKRKQRAIAGALGGAAAGGAAGYFGGDKIAAAAGQLKDKAGAAIKSMGSNGNAPDSAGVPTDAANTATQAVAETRSCDKVRKSSKPEDVIEIVDDEVAEDLERTKKGAKVGAVTGGILGAVGGAATGGLGGALAGGLGGATKGAIAGGTVGLVGDAVFGDKQKNESGGACGRPYTRKPHPKKVGEGLAEIGSAVVDFAKEHPVAAAGIGGAAIGALTDKEDRVGGALKGAALGAGAMALGGIIKNGSLMGAGSNAPVDVKPTDSAVNTLTNGDTSATTDAAVDATTDATPDAAADVATDAADTATDAVDDVEVIKPTAESIRIREARARRRIRENTLQTRDEFFDSNRVKPLPESIQNMLRTNKKLFTGNK